MYIAFLCTVYSAWALVVRTIKNDVTQTRHLLYSVLEMILLPVRISILGLEKRDRLEQIFGSYLELPLLVAAMGYDWWGFFLRRMASEDIEDEDS